MSAAALIDRALRECDIFHYYRKRDALHYLPRGESAAAYTATLKGYT